MNLELIYGTSAEIRRTQLVQVAKEIILNQGIEALRHASIAKKAGVTRALIYRYFPTQSDFFVAISEEFISALNQRLSVDAQIEAVRLSLGSNHAAADRYFDVVFSVLEEKGPASLMLLAEPDLSPKLSHFLGKLQKHQSYDWLLQSAGVNLSPIDTHVLIQVGNTTTLALYKFYRAGEISRNQAVSRVSHIICELIKAMLAKH